MADKNIMFKDAEGYLKARIDGQELELSVKEIIKQNTYIILDQSNIDIALNDDINFTGRIDTIDSMRDLLRSGLLYVTIQDLDSNELISTIVTFENRQFTVSIPNSLPAGDYKCVIDYLESKYFFGTHFEIQFKVSKRPIGYKFDKSIYIGYPNQELNIQMYLYDYKTKLPVQTMVSYRFNGQEYLGHTNKEGYITMNITIPDVIKENCKSFMKEMEQDAEEPDLNIGLHNTLDTKGWVYQNGQLIQWFNSAYHYYVGELGIDAVEINEEEEELSDINQERYHILEINIISDVYMTYPISLRIHVMKSPTTIYWEENKLIQDKTRISGYVEGAIGRVKYGAMILEVQNELEKFKFYVDDYGNFEYCYDPIQAAIASTNGLAQYQEKKGNTRKINVNLDFAVDKTDIINIINGDYGRTYVYDVYDDTQLYATAKITTIKNDNEIIPVREGMICFIIYRQRYDGKWVRSYRYSEEITDDGEAEILFDLSEEGQFYIYAEYYGMFEYNDAVSDKQYYQVRNDATTVKFNTKDALQINMDWRCDISITDDLRNGHDRRLIINDMDMETHTQVQSKALFENNDALSFDEENCINIQNIHKDIRMKKLRLQEPDIEVTQEQDNG